MIIMKFAKVYFYILLITFTLMLLDDISNFELVEVDYFYHTITFIGLIGLYGYVHSKPIWDYHFWKFFIPVSLTVDVYSIIEVFEGEVDTSMYYIAFIFIPLLVFPQYLFLYRYSTNRHLWLKDRESNICD